MDQGWPKCKNLALKHLANGSIMPRGCEKNAQHLVGPEIMTVIIDPTKPTTDPTTEPTRAHVASGTSREDSRD